MTKSGHKEHVPACNKTVSKRDIMNQTNVKLCMKFNPLYRMINKKFTHAQDSKKSMP